MFFVLSRLGIAALLVLIGAAFLRWSYTDERRGAERWSYMRFRHAGVICLACSAVFVVGTIIAVLVRGSSAVQRDYGAFFDRHRTELERVAELIATQALVAPEGESRYYGATLPPDLRHLSVTGKVSIWDDGSIFVPRWTGIPDDAGGYWHRSESPEGLDMYGMRCADPVVLGDDWWACGMD